MAAEKMVGQGFKVIQSKKAPPNAVNSHEARQILTMLITQSSQKNGVEYPRDIVFRFHGSENSIEIFEVTNVKPAFRPIQTLDQAKFSDE